MKDFLNTRIGVLLIIWPDWFQSTLKAGKCESEFRLWLSGRVSGSPFIKHFFTGLSPQKRILLNLWAWMNVFPFALWVISTDSKWHETTYVPVPNQDRGGRGLLTQSIIGSHNKLINLKPPVWCKNRWLFPRRAKTYKYFVESWHWLGWELYLFVCFQSFVVVTSRAVIRDLKIRGREG